MPSFLNKVFGYKRHDDKEAPREPSSDTLLDGRYEAILSPTASTFAETQQPKDADRDPLFSLFKSKSRGASQKQRKPEDAPLLTLQLPGPKENRSLGVVFEADPDSQIILDDAVIAAKRLNPSDALVLVRACARAITERGLETLGIMHPQWFSASPDVQRRLISLFIRSFAQSRTTTLPPTPSPPAFENELRYTRLPHDVAAVLRWGLRHLSLENGHFGKDAAEWGWYDAFFQAERDASYPLRGFSELLLPQLPAPHAELLTTALSLISSLASHAETNSISGSKLSKFLGLWLLVATRAEEADDWNRFYARWERSGRVLEHLFLARLREESSMQRLPTRLQELVKSYPYTKGSPALDDGLLSRPRFSTRQYDALFVRVESTLVRDGQRPKQHPIRLLLEAFQLPIEDPSRDEHVALWHALKKSVFEEATSSDAEGPQFTRIFVDETIHLLSLIPTDNNPLMSPTLLTSPITAVSRKPSLLTKTSEQVVSKSNNGHTPISPPVSPTSPITITDWSQFTLSGFGEAPTTQPLAALLSQDDDIEVTQPRISRKSSRHRGKSRSRRRPSEDHEPLDPPSSSHADAESIVETKLASVHVVQIDEAFIDFWSDAIVDPISAGWPTFVVCGLKQTPSAERIRWLVIEQAYTRQEPQACRDSSPNGRRGRSPRPSFKSDISGFRINSVFSSARKRFSLFSNSVTDLDPKRAGGKTPVAGELGEVLNEEDPLHPSVPPTEAGLHLDGNAAVRATVTRGATADLPDHLEVTTPPPPAPAPQESDPVQAAVKAPSIEPDSRSDNGTSVMPRPPVRASEETISAERDSSPRAVDVNPKAGIIAPLTADTPRVTCDSKATLGSAFSVENARGAHVQAESGQQDIAVEAEGPTGLVADAPLHAEVTGAPSVVVQVDVADDGSRKGTDVVAMSSPPDTVAPVATTPAVPPAAAVAVDDEAPEPAVEEPYVAKHSVQEPSVDPVAALAVESVVRQEIDDRDPLSSPETVAAETGAQLAPHSTTSVVDEEAQDTAEHAEIPTPAPELVAVVEETPSQEASDDVCGHAGDARDTATQPEVLDGATSQLVDAAPQPVAAELQAPLQAEGSSATRSEEAPCVEVVDTSVAAEREPAAAQVPELLAEEAQPHVQDDVAQIAGTPLVEGLSPPEAQDVSARIASTQAEDAAPMEAEAQTVPASSVREDLDGTRDGGAPSPLLEHLPSVDETAGSVMPADAHEPVDTDPVVSPEFDVAEAKTQEPTVESVVEAKSSPLLPEEAEPSPGTEVSAQVGDVQAAAETLSIGSNLEAATADLATQDEVVIAVKADAQSTHDAPAEDAEAPASATEDATVEDAPEVAVEPVPITAPEAQSVEHDAPEPVSEPSQVLADATPSASEPVAIAPIAPHEEPVVVRDAQASMEVDEPSSVPAPPSVDDAGTRVGAPEEVMAVQEDDAPLDPDVAPPALDVADEVLAEGAKPAPVADEETEVDVGATELGTPAADPELTEVDVPAPVATEDAPVVVEADDSTPAVVVTSDQVPVGCAEIDETAHVDQAQKADELAAPVTSESSVSTHESARLSEDTAPAVV